jgi:hypothetical protein
MRYQIRGFRYSDSWWTVCYKDTYEEAVKEIDRLAKLEKEKRKSFWGGFGDSVDYTFVPIGG